MLKSAGRLTTRAKSSLRIPFAALMSLKILPILNTLTTRKSVGDTGKSIIISSIRIPRMDANTTNFTFAWILQEGVSNPCVQNYKVTTFTFLLYNIIHMLKLSMITPIKRLSVKNEPHTMNMTK
ncbi:hypothetical protein ALC56_14494 [Trachymyrmex septentrionalis]|uniref:Uncharacterized protein n=1 Tax=Trachymyrmex septentrionalis TaxID=34720 RepID=A0A195ESU3_9HYME|nr:hypothetical protein ALC56_14494 [Trachymyrmex septentrionalis]